MCVEWSGWRRWWRRQSTNGIMILVLCIYSVLGTVLYGLLAHALHTFAISLLILGSFWQSLHVLRTVCVCVCHHLSSGAGMHEHEHLASSISLHLAALYNLEIFFPTTEGVKFHAINSRFPCRAVVVDDGTEAATQSLSHPSTIVVAVSKHRAVHDMKPHLHTFSISLEQNFLMPHTRCGMCCAFCLWHVPFPIACNVILSHCLFRLETEMQLELRQRDDWCDRHRHAERHTKRHHRHPLSVEADNLRNWIDLRAANFPIIISEAWLRCVSPSKRRQSRRSAKFGLLLLLSAYIAEKKIVLRQQRDAHRIQLSLTSHRRVWRCKNCS